MTPAEASWSKACRHLLSLTKGGVVAIIAEKCPVPWIRRAFSAPGARPLIATGVVYRLMIGDQPWPALAVMVERREPGKATRTAYALFTIMPDGTTDVLGRSKIDSSRLTDPAKMLG